MKVKWWYKYLVPHLLDTCFFYRIRYQKFLDQYREAELEIKKTKIKGQKQANSIKKLKKAAYDLKRELEDLRRKDPLGKSIDAARHHAAQDRIRTLEAQVIHLGGKTQ
jgi:multidrug resistance efflux pump